jgi:stage V sporulation protein R
MKKSDLQRLIKLEDRIKEIIIDMGLKYVDVEFDVCSAQKMLEIMSYRLPTNISSWKYGRDYERARTIYENIDPGLPYEVVIHSDPARAYLMNNNTLAVQCLVIAHVYGHVNFFTENKYFANSRYDMMGFMAEATKRFVKYEKRYGIDEVERIVDAGHAIQLHSSPFETETEQEKRERIFKQAKKEIHKKEDRSEFGDLSDSVSFKLHGDVDLINQRLWRHLSNKTPVEPTEDLLRYIIDNSSILEDWQKDILETLRYEGQYFWPIIKTKTMNEGWATMIHEKVMYQLFKEGLLNSQEHAQFNYSNSLVKAKNKMGMNPYLIGSTMWRDIEDRWNKGKYGKEWKECTDTVEKDNWDTKDGKGWEKCKSVMKSYTDWFFMQDYLTVDIIDDIDLYLYKPVTMQNTIDYIRTAHTAEEIRQIIINSFAHSGIPKIEVVDGNMRNSGYLRLFHNWGGSNLEKNYTLETMSHIRDLWGRLIALETKVNEKKIIFVAKAEDESMTKRDMEKIWEDFATSSTSTAFDTDTTLQNYYVMLK